MLTHNHIPLLYLRLQPLQDLHPPTPLLKRLTHTLALLHASRMRPASEKARFNLLVQAVVDGEFAGSGGGHEVVEVGDGVGFGEGGGEEVV